ncbi:hypothetical protein Mal52_13790 [Symmachiella dynata]|uniref:Replication-relaxation n=1 Tax=Symmachiella dynata TaxID=2527995 RepID=A0A517ZK85_9PLAN|nr:replication-relaxation family protein [Symmachiella dynata]QDU42910.1 hypothetical protein Mal52_13790 [Symmachiella dynata]
MPRGKSNIVPSPIRLLPAHIEQLQTLGEVELLDSDDFGSRFYPNDRTGQSYRRRLRLYTQHGLLQRIELPLVSTGRQGRLPNIYRLTPKGADLLEQETGQRPPRYARSDPPRQSHTWLHRLGIAKIQLSFNDACAQAGLPKPDWLLEYDTLPEAKINGPMSERFVLCHQFPLANGKKLTAWPDAAALLRVPQAGQIWRLGLFVEYDRSTETHTQLNGTKRSHAGNGKLDGYSALLKTGEYQQYWPDADGVRILFVVRSEGRLRNIAETFRDHGVADSVRFAVEAEMTPERVLNSQIWRTIDGERRSIIRGSTSTVRDSDATS